MGLLQADCADLILPRNDAELLGRATSDSARKDFESLQRHSRLSESRQTGLWLWLGSRRSIFRFRGGLHGADATDTSNLCQGTEFAILTRVSDRFATDARRGLLGRKRFSIQCSLPRSSHAPSLSASSGTSRSSATPTPAFPMTSCLPGLPYERHGQLCRQRSHGRFLRSTETRTGKPTNLPDTSQSLSRRV